MAAASVSQHVLSWSINLCFYFIWRDDVRINVRGVSNYLMKHEEITPPPLSHINTVTSCFQRNIRVMTLPLSGYVGRATSIQTATDGLEGHSCCHGNSHVSFSSEFAGCWAGHQSSSPPLSPSPPSHGIPAAAAGPSCPGMSARHLQITPAVLKHGDSRVGCCGEKCSIKWLKTMILGPVVP